VKRLLSLALEAIEAVSNPVDNSAAVFDIKDWTPMGDIQRCRNFADSDLVR
jgi:hypothetical protein